MTIPREVEARVSRRFRSSSGVGIGWHPIIRDLDAKIAVLDPGYTIVQIKEKWGGLRYYYDNSAECSEASAAEVMRLVDAAQDESTRTCELCGNQGELRSEQAHFKTLCDAHSGC